MAAAFDEARRQVQAATDQFLQGNPASFQAHWSHGEDVTIFGGWGAYERGWEQVGPRLAWAAARFAGGEQTYQVLSSGTSGDLAYTVALEQAQVRVVGQDMPAPMVLRVTHLYRREQGEWKLIHRHADPIVSKTDTAAVLQR